MKTRLTAKGRALRNGSLRFAGWAMLIGLSVSAVAAAFMAIGPHAAAFMRDWQKASAKPVVQVVSPPAPAIQTTMPTAPQRVSPAPMSSPRIVDFRVFQFTWPRIEKRHDWRGQTPTYSRPVVREAPQPRKEKSSGKSKNDNDRSRFPKPKDKSENKPDIRVENKGGEKKSMDKRK